MFKYRVVEPISPLDNSLFSFPINLPSTNLGNTSSTAIDNTLFLPQEVHVSLPLPTNLAQAHAVKNLRNGKTISDPCECVDEGKATDYSSAEEEDHRESKKGAGELEKEEELEDRRESIEKEGKSMQKGEKEPVPCNYNPILPFPKALGRLKPLLEGNPLLHSFKDTTITIPLEDAIKYIPNFTKYVKDLVTLPRKKKLVKLSERISSIMLGGLLEKKFDPGAHLITCKISGNKFEKTLLDSGASINLMPKSIYNKFKFRDLEPIGLTLQMANGSTSPACGILEDLIVIVEDFKFPIDLVVADVSDKGDPSQIPLILGRPFLATSKAITDWDKGEVKIKVGDEEIQLSLTKLMRKPQASLVDVFTCDLEEEIRIEEEELVEEFKKEEKEEGESENPIPLAGDTHDLKPLPSSLKYAFLGENNSNPVIISADLKPDQEFSLLEVLKAHKEALAWSFSNIKGIPSHICEHRIFVDENSCPSREPHRRLNPHMLEVLRTEIMKWWNGGVIYSILDSPWITPVHMVTKKSGIIVTIDEKGEEVPMRMTTGWRVCIDYRRLNAVTKKDHYPLPFIDQILEKLSGENYFCFLDGYSGYKPNQYF